MSYKIVKGETQDTLVNADGGEIATLNHPVTVPDDIIDAILEDTGVGNPQIEALSVLFKRDWEIVEFEQS